MKNVNYMVTDAVGNPIMRQGDEANPYMFNTLREAFKFAEEEIKGKDAISVVKVDILETFSK